MFDRSVSDRSKHGRASRQDKELRLVCPERGQSIESTTCTACANYSECGVCDPPLSREDQAIRLPCEKAGTAA